MAAGYSQRRSAQLIGVDDRSVRRWWTEERFRELVMQRREELMASQRPLFESTVALSQQLVLGALTGEYEPDDPRVELARSILQRTVWRIVQPGHAGLAAGQQLPQLPSGGDAA